MKDKVPSPTHSAPGAQLNRQASLVAVQIRRAEGSDAAELTVIAHAAKRRWEYPEDWMELWRDELTVDEHYVDTNWVFLAEEGTTVSGWCSVAKDQDGCWLDHCWVLPEAAGRGIGQMLVHRALSLASQLQFVSLKVISDPNAEGFYRKLGFRHVGEHPSKPEGRRLPVLEASLHGDA